MMKCMVLAQITLPIEPTGGDTSTASGWTEATSNSTSHWTSSAREEPPLAQCRHGKRSLTTPHRLGFAEANRSRRPRGGT